MVAKVLGELGSFVDRGPELVEDSLLCWVEVGCGGAVVDRVHAGSMA